MITIHSVINQFKKGQIDGCYLAYLYAEGVITPTELVLELLELAKQDHNAIFTCLTAKRAIGEALASTERWRQKTPKSAFDGVPVTWKDLFDISDTITTAGSCTRNNDATAQGDAALVKRLSAAGMINIGKTNLSEFAFSGIGINPHFGTPVIRDIHCNEHVPGGSSSGAAAAVSSGFTPISIGTDTAGSIRIPAAFHGLVGYRSSRDRYSRMGVFPLAESLDTVGPICWSVRDAIVLDLIIRQQSCLNDTDLKQPLSLCVDPRLLQAAEVTPAVRNNIEYTLNRLRSLGVSIEYREIDVIHQSLEWIDKNGWPGAYEALKLHAQLLQSPDAERMDPQVRARLSRATGLSSTIMDEFLTLRPYWQQQFRYEIGDAVLVTPAVAHTAPLLSSLLNDADLFNRVNLETLRLTMPGSFLDLPSITLPTGSDDAGLFTSMLLSRPTGEDESLLFTSNWIQSKLQFFPTISGQLSMTGFLNQEI